ncbi:unnamed protein product [Closterium sp. NIES-54]
MPFVFPDLGLFATVSDLATHLRSLVASYRAACNEAQLLVAPTPIWLTVHWVVTRLPDRLSIARDALLQQHPSELTIDLLETTLGKIKSNLLSVASATDAVAPRLFEGCAVLQLPTFTATCASTAVSVFEDTAAISAADREKRGKGGKKGGKGGGGNGGGGSGGDGAGGGNGGSGGGTPGGGSPGGGAGPPAGGGSTNGGAGPSSTSHSRDSSSDRHHNSFSRGDPRCTIARSSTTLLCPVVPSGVLRGLHIPSFTRNLVGVGYLQNRGITVTFVGGGRIAACTDAATGVVLATFTREPRLGLYVLHTELSPVASSAQVDASPPVPVSSPVAVSSQVVVSSQVAVSCSCRTLAHLTVLWHHRLGHPSLPRLRSMASQSLVSGLPHVFPSLPPSLGPSCTPCIADRLRATPHSSSLVRPLLPSRLSSWTGVGAGGAGTGGASSGGAEAGVIGTGGAGSGGAGAGGAGAGGASFGGTEARGTGSSGASSGGAGAGGAGAVGASSEETGAGGMTTAAPTVPPHRYDTRLQALRRLEREEQEGLEQERQELQQLDQQQQQQQPPHPPLLQQLFPPLSGLRALGLPSSPPVHSLSPTAYDYSLSSACSSLVSFDDLRTVLFCSSPHRAPPVRVLPSPPESSLTISSHPIIDYYHAARPIVTRFLPLLSRTLMPLRRLTRLLLPQFELEFLAVASPSLCAMLLSPEGDPDALDIPTPRTYREVVSGEWASRWKVAMDSELASWRSTGTYIDAVPPPRANVVDGMWLFKVKQPPGSPSVFKAHYLARGFSQHEGFYFFQTFARTLEMTTLRVLLHVAAQRDYELHSLDFSTAFLQGRLHEEIWLRCPPGFTDTFPPGTQWSLRRPVYGLRQSLCEWHETLRSMLRDLGFRPSSADPLVVLGGYGRTDPLLNKPFFPNGLMVGILTCVVAVGAARGTPRTPFFEGCSPFPLAPSYASAAAVDVLGAEDVGAASTSGKRRSSKGKGGRGGGDGSGVGGGGTSGGGGSGGSGGGSGGSGGGGGGSGGSDGSGSGGSGGDRTVAQRGGSEGGQRQRQQRRSETSSPQQLCEWLFRRGVSRGQVAPPCSCRLLSHKTLLWHHGLGHPSLPRLHDMHSRLLVSGLPRSLPPLPPSPAPPCLPCVEGQQRAAPHSSSFPSTTAPLQTLHMDVWGPARVSGHGRERYFLLSVSSSASGSSRTFPSYVCTLTEVQNGIAEHRIGLVMEVARTSMIHEVAPHFLWPFAVWYAAHRLNLWPRVSLPETSPTLRWMGKVGDASVFRVRGSYAFVRDTSADKLPDAPGWKFYHPTLRHVFSSQDVTFDKSVPFYRLFPYHSALPPPPLLFLSPVDPLPGIVPVEVAGDSGATRGYAFGSAESRGAESKGAGSGGAELGGAEPGVSELAGVVPGGAEPEGFEPGGAESDGAESGGAKPQGASSSGGLAAGGTGGTAAAGPRGARTRGTGAAGIGGVGGAVARDPTEPGAAGAGGARAGGTGGGGARGGGAGAVGAGAGGTGAGGAGAGGAGVIDPGAGGAGGTGRPRLYFVPLLQQDLGVPSSTGLPPPLLCPPPDQAQPPLQSASPLPAPSPYTEKTGGLTEYREPATCPASPVCTGCRVPRLRPPPVPGTHTMALRPSSIPLRIPQPPPPESSLPAVRDLESNCVHAASPTISRLLANVVTDPSFESTVASALVAELVDFAAACRLDYATALVGESESASPPSIGGECALGTDVLQDRHENFECLAAAVPRFASMMLAPEGDPDAPDIPTPRSYAEAITGTYIDKVSRPGANIVDGMWIFRVKRPPGSLPAFKARYVARGFNQRRGVDYFQTFSPTPTMTTLEVLLPVLQRFGFEFSSPQPTPQSTGHSFSAPPSDESVEPSGPYPELVGCLMYLMTCTRPDLAYPLSLVACYVAPGRHRKVHWDAAKRVLRYLCSTSGMGLVLGGRGLVVLTGHTDASWVDNSATQRSSQGYTFSLGSASFSWRSTRSSLVLSSSCEAEIYAGAMAAQELRWLTYLLTDLGEKSRSPPALYVDNKAMIALCQEHRLDHRMKHIALRYFLARELQQRGQLRLAYVATRANTADIFTKALPPGDH